MNKDNNKTSLSLGLGVIVALALIAAFILIFLWGSTRTLEDVYFMMEAVFRKKEISQETQEILQRMIVSGKLLSAKDYFGFYISYYNNLIIVLTALITVFGGVSFIYFKKTNEEGLQEIRDTQDAKIKSLIQEVINDRLREYRDLEKDFNEMAELVDKMQGDVEFMKTKVQTSDIEQELKPLETSEKSECN